ncbi:hypothetical protein AU099_gp69 [Gordonia phage GTE8]|uniref:Uncharacterized protein n=1 Tax=Gordonia phage GTE8 TaxID=1647475 RepID=A0A0K0N6Q9_9CAUD|nr:hypothetical protein AU099_gp69 [Gordonia phage GTE8]AKJ72412.1 hypothetical protein GTE8_69 [Gordonia phage GTE8]
MATIPALTLDAIPHADALTYDDVELRDRYPDNGPAVRAFRVTGRRVSGVLTARVGLSGAGAPTHRVDEPATGHRGMQDLPMASYPSVSLTFGPRAAGKFLNVDGHDAMYPDPFTVNGRAYYGLPSSVTFHPVDVRALYGDDVDTSPVGITTSSAWHGMTADEARKRLAPIIHQAGAHGYLFANNVPGTDGRTASGVFESDTDSWTYGTTDSARAIVRAIGIDVLRILLDDGVENDWWDLIADDVARDRDKALAAAQRYMAVVEGHRDTLRRISTAALMSTAPTGGVEVVEVTR